MLDGDLMVVDYSRTPVRGDLIMYGDQGDLVFSEFSGQPDVVAVVMCIIHKPRRRAQLSLVKGVR